MDDVIYRRDAVDAIKLKGSPYLFGMTDKDRAIEEAVKNVPSVDVVEVVRCEYCMNRCSDYYCPEIERDVSSDFFCEKGIRKTDG